jgi:hypothetical protein
MGLAVGLPTGILEELGWTGFATRRLRLRYGVLGTGLICRGALAFRVLMVWVYERTDEILLAAMLMRVSLAAFAVILFPRWRLSAT